MIMKCPKDQSELVDNFCSQCYTLFFEAKDMIAIEIDAKTLWPDAEWPLTETQSESLEGIFSAVRKGWAKTVNNPVEQEAFIFSSPFVKIHRYAVEDQELKGLYDLAKSMADLLYDINQGKISRGDPKLRELNQAFYKCNFMKPDQIKIGYDSTVESIPANQATPECASGCSHSDEEHEAFDAGYFRRPNPYPDDPYLADIYRIGQAGAPSKSIHGHPNRMDITVESLFVDHDDAIAPAPADCQKTLDQCPDRYSNDDAFDPAKRRK